MSSTTQRSAQIDRIVSRVRRELERHATIDHERIIKDHPQLMPDLQLRLDTLREVLEVAKSATPNPPSAQTTTGDDLAVLAAALTDYTFLECIAQGGQGAVYKAIHQPSGATVAFKILIDGPLATRRQRERFQSEMDLVARLAHPGIVKLLDSGVARGRLYYAMEYVEGLPVDAHVRFNTMDVRSTLTLFARICDALSHAHVHGVVHHDLKPTNVLVDEAGQPRILDFGLARDPRGVVTSNTNGTIDALRFRPAEELLALTAGHRVDVRGDIYALGVMLFNALTDSFPYDLTYEGHTPQLSQQPLTLRTALVRQPCRRISADHITHDLEAVVRKAVASDIDDRYDSAAALADDLRNVLANRPVKAPAIKQPRTTPRQRMALAALGVALIALGTWSQWPRQQQPMLQGPVARTVLTAGTADSTANLLDRVERQLGDAAAIGFDAPWLRAQVQEQNGDLAFERGRRMEAAKYYLAVLEATAQALDGIDDTERQLARVRAHRKLGSCLDSPSKHLEQAECLSRQLIESKHLVRSATMELARVKLAKAQYQYDTGHYAHALELAEEARAMTPKFASHPDDSGILELQAMCWGIAGRALGKLARHEQARVALSRSLDIRRDLKDANELDPGRLISLLIACKNVGDNVRDGGHDKEAQELYEEANSIGEKLCRLDPGALQWQYELYGAYDRLARLLLGLEKTADASVAAKRARELADKLMDAEPQNARWQRISGFAELLEGRVLLWQGEYSSAARSFERSLQVRHALAAANPSDIVLQGELATSHKFLAKAHRLSNEAEASLHHYERALAIRKQIADMTPTNIRAQFDFIRSQNDLATWHLVQKQKDNDVQAQELLQDAEDRLYKGEKDGIMANDSLRLKKLRGVINLNLQLVGRRLNLSDAAED